MAARATPARLRAGTLAISAFYWAAEEGLLRDNPLRGMKSRGINGDSAR